MVLNNRPYTFDRVFRLAATGGILYAVVSLMAHLSDVLIPFVIAFLLAYLLNPVVARVQERVPNRVAAVALTLTAVTFIVTIVAAVTIPLMMGELAHMAALARKVLSDADLAARASASLPPEIWEAIRDYAAQDNLRELLKQRDFWSLAQAILRKVLPSVWGLVAGTTNILIGLVGMSVIGLYMVFMLLDFRRIKAEGKNLLPPSWREPVLEFLREFDASMSRYFRAQAVVALLVGILFAVGFSLIGLPMGIVLGLFVGALNMVPYLQIIGTIPAGLLAVVMALETGNGVFTAVGLVLLVFIVVQGIQDAVIVPKVMGEVTGMSPAMILLSISIWGKLLGFLGLVIALPATCLATAYYQRLITLDKKTGNP
ncbi:MAG: AI-2E family transporter [Elusimicrobia bacterium]|nr:MAG: AI-2E family transporter [Elusimicrobiota bacterium]